MYGTQVQEAIQASAAAPGSIPGAASDAYIAYSAPKWCTPPTRPAAQKIQPIRFSGRRLAITAPLVENITAPHAYSTQ